MENAVVWLCELLGVHSPLAVGVATGILVATPVIFVTLFALLFAWAWIMTVIERSYEAGRVPPSN